MPKLNNVSIALEQKQLCLADLVKIRDFSGLSFEEIKTLNDSGKELPLVEFNDSELFFESQVLVDFIQSLESKSSLNVGGEITSLEALKEKAKEAKGFNRASM